MTAVVETRGLGKQYHRTWALADCTLSIPAGHVVGLVGPNGAGKTTLLNLATGMLAPTTGTIEVLGARPAAGPAQLARVGYLAQDAPVYAGLSVADHLRLGAHLNPGWDDGVPGHPGAWILSSGAVNAAGNPVGTVTACAHAFFGSPSSTMTCLASHGIRVGVTYQPACRYWAFEWTETAIFFAVALALAGYGAWRLARRRT